MASKVRHNFKESALALLRGDWCNRVARRVSYWMGENGVDVVMPDTPSGNDPIKVRLNVTTAAQLLSGEMLSKGLLGRTNGVPFYLKPLLNVQATAIASLNVYLPTLTFTHGGTEYTVETGSGTGFVTLLSANTGWYRINGITTGDVYLVDDSTSSANRMKFATAKPTDTSKAYIHIGKVTFDSGTAKAEQYEHPMRGGVEFGGGGGGGGEGMVVPLAMRAVINSGQTAISQLEVYVPSLSMAFGHTDYTIETGTASGQLSAIGDGWYKINGITSGNVYLVDDSSTATSGVVTFKAKFSTSIPAANKLCHQVAAVSFNATAKVANIVQYPTVMGAVCGSCDMERISGANTNLHVWRSSTGGDNYPSGSVRGRDTQTWERDVTGTWKGDWADSTQTPSEVDTKPNGVRIQFVDRIERFDTEDVLYLRYAYFDKNGCLYKIDAEAEKCFMVRNVNFS